MKALLRWAERHRDRRRGPVRSSGAHLQDVASMTVIACSCTCPCHAVCSCDLGLSLRAWRCRQHEGGHCGDCRPGWVLSAGGMARPA
jgi:hypothetical protein